MHIRVSTCRHSIAERWITANPNFVGAHTYCNCMSKSGYGPPNTRATQIAFRDHRLQSYIYDWYCMHRIGLPPSSAHAEYLLRAQIQFAPTGSSDRFGVLTPVQPGLTKSSPGMTVGIVYLLFRLQRRHGRRCEVSSEPIGGAIHHARTKRGLKWNWWPSRDSPTSGAQPQDAVLTHVSGWFRVVYINPTGFTKEGRHEQRPLGSDRTHLAHR